MYIVAINGKFKVDGNLPVGQKRKLGHPKCLYILLVISTCASPNEVNASISAP